MGQASSQPQPQLMLSRNIKTARHQPLSLQTTKITIQQVKSYISKQALEVFLDNRLRILQVPQRYVISPYRSQQFYRINKLGVCYSGEWMEGIPHGQGQAVFQDGSYFKGYFRAGKANGPQCLYAASTGGYYLGQMVDNHRKGKGVFRHRRYRYQGQWKQSVPDGQGSQIYQNGDEYTGQYSKGVKQGKGTYTWRQGIYKSYQGMFKDNFIDGKGLLVMRSGDTIQGNFNCQHQIDITSGQVLINNQHGIFHIKDAKEGITGTRQDKKGKKYHLFEDKQLIHLQEGRQKIQIKRIIKVIEGAYQDCRKHSQALKKIRQQLSDYRVELHQHSHNKDAFFVVELCGRLISVSDK